MRDFFRFETDYDAGNGFELFDSCHLAWIFGIAIFTGITTVWYVRQDKERQKQINTMIGIIFPVLSIYRDVMLAVTGHFSVGFLPFHLCSMAYWIACIYIWTGNRFSGVVYVLLCLPGTLAALLFPDWNRYPFLNYMHIHGFVSHGLLFAFGIWLISSGRVMPKWREFWKPVVFGAVGVPLIHLLNEKIGTNFWFLDRPSYGSPLVSLYELTGDTWYIAGYFLFCILVVAVWQTVLWMCVVVKRKAYELIDNQGTNKIF